MKIWANKYKKSVKASNEGRSDLIYVIMVNGDPVAKGSYDAMVKKSYTYNFPVHMLKFPKAKLNSLIKMAKDAHRPNPLKFAVNRFINDNTSEYDSLNASTNRNIVTASTKPSYRSGEEAIRNACNVINVFFAGKEPDMWDGLYNDTNTKYFVDQHKDRSGGIDTESVVQEWRETYDEAYDPRDYLFNILRDQLGYSYDEAERMLIYASTACNKRSVKASTSGNIPYDLVSMLVALRDYISIDDTDYINDEHRMLVDVADSLYNAGITVAEMSPEYQAVYNKYGKDFFDLVLDDVAALDTQITANNVNDLIEDYNDREASYTGVNASTKRRRNTMSIKASRNRKRKPIMAGAGAGYTIEWELDTIRKINSFDVTDVSKPDKYGTVTVTADCDVDIDVTIKSAWSYMYGFSHPIEGVSAKIYRIIFDYNIPDNYDEILNPDDYEDGVDDPAFIDEVMNAMYQLNEMEAMNILENDAWETIKGDNFSYGGGWIHSKWDGTLLDIDEYNYALIQVTNSIVIDYVDAAVINENFTVEYTLDSYLFQDMYFDTEDEAREAAIDAFRSGELEEDVDIEKTEWHEILLDTEGSTDMDDPYTETVDTLYYDDYVTEVE